jgi:hypothetical protein
MPESRHRLTSWKEIAAHFGRDVRTVMRWEKERALPVHRGSNGRPGVVIADTKELDAWARGVEKIEDPAPAALELAEIRDPIRPGRRRLGGVGRWSTAAAMVLTAAMIGLGGWLVHVSRANEHPDTAVLTDGAVIALDADGSELWRHKFAGERVSAPFSRITNPIERIAGEGLLAATSYSVTTDNLTTRSGRLMWFNPAGTIRQSFSFEDTVRIGARDFSGPWSLSDYRQHGSGATRRIAVSGNHYEWWPSIVTVLDGQWQRRGSFIHAGWVERLRWLPGDRLAVSGFSNLKDGGMIALLDANALNGQSPPGRKSEFECTACGPGRPLRYVVMPRSEVNRVSAAPFNRASFEMRPDALLVSTAETASTTTPVPASAIYDFTPELVLRHASYTDRYWEVHRELERLGKLTHTREQCPERDGPPQIEIWDPATGWSVQTVRRTISR